jgi:signal transduction histidine kinase
LASPFTDSIGVNFYDPALKYDQTPQALEHFNKVFSGQSSLALFSYRTGERLNAAEPIIIGGKPEYFLFYVTPTAAIYSHIDSVISSERTGFYILQSAIAGAIAIALFFLLRWSGTIERAVKERTFELHNANEQLKVHDKMQREFINVAAHELRTPIQPILGSAEMMNQEFAQGKDKIEVTKAEVDMIVRNAQRLERLSSDILTVSRIEAGVMPIHLENFDIAEKIKSVVEDTKVTVPMNEKIIDILYQSPSIMIDADKPKIYEVLANLIGNAMKFTEQGSITVTAEKSSDGKEVVVNVKDTGAGISPEIMPRLFTKFAAKSEKGTGLGLYICKSIVEAHGGRIWAENNADGKGATFSFTLPIAHPKSDNNMALPLEANNGTG